MTDSTPPSLQEAMAGTMVASEAMHNMANVLSSAHVSIGLIEQQLRTSKAEMLSRMAVLMEEHESDLATFLREDARGKNIPAALKAVAARISAEHESLLREAHVVRRSLEHVRRIVEAHQRVVAGIGKIERQNLSELVDLALDLGGGPTGLQGATILRQYEYSDWIATDAELVLQIMVNLVTNARHALRDSGVADKKLEVRTHCRGDFVAIDVMDNGVGIPKDRMGMLFQQGFTTKKGGHGLGLPSCARHAQRLGGSIQVDSPGPGLGATFTLLLPREPKGTP